MFGRINFGNLVKNSPIHQIKIPTKVSGYTVSYGTILNELGRITLCITLCTCASILIFSRGAVAVLETTPATPPARRALQIGIDAGGRGGGARSAPKLTKRKFFRTQEI